MKNKLKQIREAVDLVLENQGLESTRALVLGCKTEYGIITRIEEMQLFLNGKDKYISKDQAERYPSIIIGRDITPLDIIRILPPFWMMKYDSGNFEIVNIENYNKNSFKNEYKIIEDKPLHLQDLPTIDFIHNLIVNNK